MCSRNRGTSAQFPFVCSLVPRCNCVLTSAQTTSCGKHKEHCHVNDLIKKILLERSFGPIRARVHWTFRMQTANMDTNAELAYAIQNGDLVRVKALVEEGADIHHNNENALIISAIGIQWPIFKYLMEAGADFRVHDNSALCWCARHGQLDLVKRLVELGADIHAKQDEALGLSAQNGHIDVVKYLVENGADIHVRNNRAARLAAQDGHLAVLEYLITKGADIHIVSDFDYTLARCITNGHFGCATYLIDNGANVRANNDVAIRKSAMYGHLDMLKYLVENGACINARDDEALRFAASGGYLDMVRYLVDKGANHQESALHSAACKHQLAVVQFFFYECNYGKTNDFEYKYNLIQDTPIASHVYPEYWRRRQIQTELGQKISAHSTHLHLRPSSLKVQFMAVHFGKHFPDRQYWE